ncbi:unnamed protein product, partial [Laminaria digitata]
GRKEKRILQTKVLLLFSWLRRIKIQGIASYWRIGRVCAVWGIYSFNLYCLLVQHAFSGLPHFSDPRSLRKQDFIKNYLTGATTLCLRGAALIVFESTRG